MADARCVLALRPPIVILSLGAIHQRGEWRTMVGKSFTSFQGDCVKTNLAELHIKKNNSSKGGTERNEK